MIINFTEEEVKAIDALDKAYEKLLNECDALILKLRPDDPEPDEKEYERIQAQRPTPPPMPEPIEYRTVDGRDNVPIYSHEDLEAYHKSPEYKAYAAENKRVNDLISAQWDNWYNAGSDEWKKARKKYEKLEQEYNEALKGLIQKAEDRQFNALGDDPSTILEDAFTQVELIIRNKYTYYDGLRARGSFSARDVRALDDGNFRLDTTETRANILSSLRRHIDALPDEEKSELIAYIEKTLKTHPFISDTGTLFGQVSMLETPQTTEEKGLSAIRPRDYKRPNTKPHNLLFNNELTTDDRNYFTPVGLNKEKSVVVYTNFIPPKAVELLGLDDYHERLYAAVGSCLFAGNQFIPFSMIYNRGMLGLSPEKRGKEITPNIEQDIVDGLAMFDGRITLTNDPTGEHDNDPDFKKITINEPLLFYQIREEKVHGQTTRGIAIPSGYVPVGYRVGEMFGNEIQTDPIQAIHVDGLTYSRDNVIIQNATYKRVKEIQYHDSQKRYKREIPENKRTITYDYIAKRIKKDFETMSPTERNRLKKKIDACMKSYQESRLFDRYEHKRDGKTFYAVVIYFEPEPKKLT